MTRQEKIEELQDKAQHCALCWDCKDELREKGEEA